MLSQISVLGRASGRVAARNQGQRTLHTDVAVAAKAPKTETAEKGGQKLLTATFAELLEEQIGKYPHKDTYESSVEDLKWTTQQMQWHIRGVAGSLHDSPSKGRTAYTSQAVLRAEMLVGLLAAPKAGKLFALIPPFQQDRMIEQLNKSDAQFMLFFPRVGKTAQLADIYAVFPQIEFARFNSMGPLMDPRVPKLQAIVHTAKKNLDGMLHHIDFQVPHYPEEYLKRGLGPIGAEDVSTLIWENGSFAALSQSNLLNTANAFGEVLGFGGDSPGAILNATSPVNASGITAGLLMPIVRRQKVVVAGEVPHEEPQRIHESIPKHGVAHIVADPLTWTSLLTKSSPAQVKVFADKIRSGVVVGSDSAVDPKLVDAISTTFGIPSSCLHTTQGTAASSGIALVDGKPLPGTQCKIIDGKLAVKGANSFKGTFANGKLDASSLKDGFAVTSVKAKQNNPDSFSVL